MINRFPELGTIEKRLNSWRQEYEKKFKIQFLKCIIDKADINKEEKFKIQDTPTFVFIRNGVEIDRIDDLEESDPTVDNVTSAGEESNDENKIKQRLIKLCEQSKS